MWISNDTWQAMYEMLKSNSDEIESIKKTIECRKLISVVHNKKETTLEEALQELGIKCCFFAIDLAKQCDKEQSIAVSDNEKLRLMLKTLDSVSSALSLLKPEKPNIEPQTIGL